MKRAGDAPAFVVASWVLTRVLRKERAGGVRLTPLLPMLAACRARRSVDGNLVVGDGFPTTKTLIVYTASSPCIRLSSCRTLGWNLMIAAWDGWIDTWGAGRGWWATLPARYCYSRNASGGRRQFGLNEGIFSVLLPISRRVRCFLCWRNSGSCGLDYAARQTFCCCCTGVLPCGSLLVCQL